MTIITVTSPVGRLDAAQRRVLARTLTDAVLAPEVGQEMPLARSGFQVRFVELAIDSMAIGGVLLADQPEPSDVLSADIAVMDAHWPRSVRARAIADTLHAMAAACGLDQAPPGWWVNFRVIDEGSWGSRGGVLSILDLLDSGAFTEERAAAIRAAIAGTAA